MLTRQIAENSHRPKLHPHDLADAVARLKDANGYTQRDLTRLVGESEAQVPRILALKDSLGGRSARVPRPMLTVLWAERESCGP